MKKLTAMLVALLMAFGALAVSSAPAGAVPTCETRIAGFMTLDFDDGADGNGTGVALWDGHWIRVNIDSTAITVPGNPATLLQLWSSPSWGNDVDIVETSYQTPLFGGLVRFNSTVTVEFGLAGSMSFNGIASQSLGMAWFSFSGTLCQGIQDT
ncbi:MAG: hypothetical protein RIE08_05685 [Acidimicrobiales bacterium]